jgi:hypothetical protein
VSQITTLQESLSVSSSAKSDLHAVCSELSRCVSACVCMCVRVRVRVWEVCVHVGGSVCVCV